jgi:D-alanyl-D-alanine carboxypeptidase (penicillin-binding protein 5/6)
VLVSVAPTPGVALLGPRPVGSDDGLSRAERRQEATRVEAGVDYGRPPLWLFFLVLFTSAIVVAGLGVVRLSDPLPQSVVTQSVPAVRVVPGAVPALPWTPTGQSAQLIPSVGVASQSGPESPVPVASLTKLMTAYVILRDHPLAVGQDGPSLTMTDVDQADFEQDTATDEANVQVMSGEVLTERQLLEGLIVRSANNLADTLARWDAGSIGAFVDEMNADAAALGMTQTHYADASGYDPGSQSTAANVLVLAATLMTNPTFAGIASMSQVTLPVEGTVGSYTPYVGQNGVVGVKSGFLMVAGGCDVLALVHDVGQVPVLIFAAVTGQGTDDPLGAAGGAALAIANAAGKAMVPLSLVRAGQQLATARAGTEQVPVESARSVVLPAWPGMVLHQQVTVVDRPADGTAPGLVGIASFLLGPQRAAVVVQTTTALPRPGLVKRLF